MLNVTTATARSNSVHETLSFIMQNLNEIFWPEIGRAFT